MKESGCLVPMWPVKNLIEKSFVHGWLVKVVQALHPLTVMAIAPLFRQICCGCAVHTQCCSTGELLGHSLHLGTRHILQCSICCSFSLWQRCAFLHVKMQKCSFLSHQLLIAVIKRDMQAQQSSAALGASASLSWAEDCQPDGSTHFVSHQKGWTSLSSRNVSCAYLSSQDLPLKWDHPDQEMAQQYRWCNSHTAWGFLQWNLSNTDRRTKADQGTDLKQTFFFPTGLILTWIHLRIRFSVRLHKHFCWHRGSSRKEQAPGETEKATKGFGRTVGSWQLKVLMELSCNVEHTKRLPEHRNLKVLHDIVYLSNSQKDKRVFSCGNWKFQCVEIQLLAMSDSTTQKGDFQSFGC